MGAFDRLEGADGLGGVDEPFRLGKPDDLGVLLCSWDDFDAKNPLSAFIIPLKLFAFLFVLILLGIIFGTLVELAIPDAFVTLAVSGVLVALDILETLIELDV